MKLLGAVLAGGRSRRFGSDKAVAIFQGVPLIRRVINQLAPQCSAILICGRSVDEFASAADRPAPGLGPLGGLAAALHFARERAFDLVVTCPCDAPNVPGDLVAQLGEAPAYVADLPVVGLWPCALSEVLDRHIREHAGRSMRGWTDHIGATPRILSQAIANLNTPADLAALEERRGS